MCGACGILGGGPDWLDRIGTPGGIGATSGETRLGERQRRIGLVNRMLAPTGGRLERLRRQAHRSERHRAREDR